MSSALTPKLTSTIPVAAAAVGYNTETLGPAVTLGTNWYGMSFFGEDAARSGATQNSGGSVLISGSGENTYNANISTASVGTDPSNWTGEAFGGGGYFQATLSFSGQSYGADQPSFWSNDIENMASVSTTGEPVQWQGQSAGYGDWIEPDFAEWDASKPDQYGFGMHNWYGAVGSGDDVSTTSAGSPATLPSNIDFSQPHTYGFLWVPAQTGVKGYAKWFFDGTQVGGTVYWNRYNPATPPLPTDGSSAFSVLDTRHLALLLGTASPVNPMTVYNVSVWQSSSANDIVHGTASAPTTPPASTEDSLALRVSEDAWRGDAQFIVKVNGVQAGGVLTANIFHSTQDSELFLLTGAWGQNLQNVQVQFLNDAYGGSAAEDRNLYVNSLAYNNVTYAGTTASMYGDGAVNFPVAGNTPTATAPADTLTLNLSEDAWKGNAEFIFTLDGKQVSTAQSVSVLHRSGEWQAFSFEGNFGVGSHTVGVEFTNDAYGGTPATDRNLYVDGGTINGQQLANNTTVLWSTGSIENYALTTTH